MSAWVQLRTASGEILPLRVRLCDTFLCRLRGLTFRKALAEDEGLLFVESQESRVGTAIHMFFVFFPIAVIWMAGDGTVVDTCLARPFRPYYAPRAPARYFLEADPRWLDHISRGDKLTIV